MTGWPPTSRADLAMLAVIMLALFLGYLAAALFLGPLRHVPLIPERPET